MSQEKKEWNELVQPSLPLSPTTLEWAEAVSIIDSCVHDVIANSLDEDEQAKLMSAWSRMLVG
jgi:hypothetical protein